MDLRFTSAVGGTLGSILLSVSCFQLFFTLVFLPSIASPGPVPVYPFFL